MYYRKFVDFLKHHYLYDEEIFDYWEKHKINFDYREEEQRDFIGCFYSLRNNILEKIRLIVPFIDDDKTLLINIHEYVHLFLMYPKLNKKCLLGMDREVLPILYERIYIKENSTEELLAYYEYLNSFIKENNHEEYVIALDVSDKLLDMYYDNVYRNEKEAKKMVKKLYKVK